MPICDGSGNVIQWIGTNTDIHEQKIASEALHESERRLQLSQAAAKTTADVIVFAGVHFMAETAKILNPTRRVVLPDMDAGCSLSDGCPADRFAAFTARHPDHYVISYINCSSGVKALSDCICTSSNAEKIVRSVRSTAGCAGW